MSALSGFLGGATIGAGTAYTKLADEQRAFRIDQTKQDALYARMLNLKRAEKGMEKSGVLDESGLPMTNEQLEGYGGDRGALMGPVDQAATLQKIKEADQPSQFVNPQTRQILTKGELEEYRKVNGSFDGLSTVGQIQRQDTLEGREYQEARDAARFTQQEELQNQRLAESEERQIRGIDAQIEKAAKVSEEKERKAAREAEEKERKALETRLKAKESEWLKMKPSLSDAKKAMNSGDFEYYVDNNDRNVEINMLKSEIQAATKFLETLSPEDAGRLIELRPELKNLAALPNTVDHLIAQGIETEAEATSLFKKLNKSNGKPHTDAEAKKLARESFNYAMAEGYAVYNKWTNEWRLVK